VPPARLAPRDKAHGIEMEITGPGIVEGLRMADHQQKRVHPRRVPGIGQSGKDIARPVEPDIVAVEAEERLAVDQRQRLDEAPAGFEQGLAFVRNGDGRGLAHQDMGFKLVGQIVGIDHRARHARL
jgi:hypothetical protein